MVIVMRDVDISKVGVSRIGQDLEEICGEPSVPEEPAALLSSIAAPGRQLVVRKQVARELLKDVVAHRGEDPDGKLWYVVIRSKARRAPNYALDLILVTVAYPGHHQLCLGESLVKRLGFFVVLDEGHGSSDPTSKSINGQ